MEKTKRIKDFLEDMEKSLYDLRSETENGDIIRIISALRFLDLKEMEDQNVLIYYDNYIEPAEVLCKENGTEYIFMMMIFYTNVMYKMAKVYTKLPEKGETELVKSIKGIEREFANMIRKVCEDSRVAIDEANREQVYCTIATFLDKATNLKGMFEGNPRQSDPLEKIEDIRKIYSSIKIKRKYIYYFDYIENKNKKICKDDGSFVYAVMNIFSKVYVETVIMLKEYDPIGMWCPMLPWKLLNEFRIILRNLFLF